MWTHFISFANPEFRISPMRLYSILIIFFLSLSIVTNAQQPNRSDLEKRRTNLLDEIANTQSQLEATKKDKKATMGQLNALMAKLKARQKLIGNINSELDKINGNITMSATEIQTLNNNLVTLQMAYAQSIRYAYKHRVNQNMIAFLFSAKDFNDAIRRMQYLRKYRDYRKEQAEKIRVTQGKLTNQISVLNAQKNEKGKLLQVEEVQKNQIQTETQQTNQVVTELRGREKELMTQIQSNQRTARKLETSIKDLIRREIEAARKKALEEARKKAADEALAKKRADEEARRKATANNNSNNGGYQSGGVTLNTGSGATATNNPPTTKPNNNTNNPVPSAKPPATVNVQEPERPSYKLSLTPEVQNLSNSFAASKGRLPWPVEKGFISSYFGKHPHPLFPKVTIDNNGIDITTDPGASVRAVFSGTVQAVTTISGTVIMINHGEYFTIYNNLSGANVRAGDKVSAKQVIGRAGRNDEGDNMINFQIWKIVGNSSVPVDPSGWIAR
jgi:septal ring factor EnvC (AmiA/AmiB activator)